MRNFNAVYACAAALAKGQRLNAGDVIAEETTILKRTSVRLWKPRSFRDYYDTSLAFVRLVGPTAAERTTKPLKKRVAWL